MRKIIALLVLMIVGFGSVFAEGNFTVRRRNCIETTYYDEGLLYADKAEVLALCRKKIKEWKDSDSESCKSDDVLNSGIEIMDLDSYNDEYMENYGYSFTTIQFGDCTVYQYTFKVKDKDETIYIQAFVSISDVECPCEHCQVSICDLLGIDEDN